MSTRPDKPLCGNGKVPVPPWDPIKQGLFGLAGKRLGSIVTHWGPLATL